ncbi:hypothetical protein DEU56DRAFT_240413 [Suillus clintonianus]|uniref:uncharacterized protein n=1 Tax=Suillus clintonianus TaxID=1904413 RepID=UPI001B87E103|nr:uncharacterized protein DEU56DRAFT_240413 [Suillus clintonianus]KAG2111021.1 hypothetical protein DEU56DRAFT_240413 [Suillus clintonianus]
MQHRPHIVAVVAVCDDKVWSPLSPLFCILIVLICCLTAQSTRGETQGVQAQSQRQAQSHSQASSSRPQVTVIPAMSTISTTGAATTPSPSPFDALPVNYTDDQYDENSAAHHPACMLAMFIHVLTFWLQSTCVFLFPV